MTESIKRRVEDWVYWSGGTEYPWQGDCMIEIVMLKELIEVAEQAPKRAKVDFMARFPANES